MRIVRIRIKNFPCIREAEIFPGNHNVLKSSQNHSPSMIAFFSPDAQSRQDQESEQ